MKKIVYTALAVVMTAALTVGCGEKNSEGSGKNMVGDFDTDGNGNIAQEDMPYGSHMSELSNAFDEKITYKISYDSRYFANGDDQDLTEIYKLHDFIAALNTKDAELLKSLYYPEFLEYVCEHNGYSDTDEYFDSLYNSVENSLGKNFTINYICVSDCLDESDETAAAYFKNASENLAAVDNSAADKITSKKLVEIGGDTCYETDEGSFLLTKHMNPFVLAVYEIDGEVYIL
ncbi:MAG: hypothetical protein J6B75_10585 [Ruminococcus sp.]|nr:hypothetical protein [Ruminococcus sp.]